MPEMDPHLQNALYGTPKLNPDEQNHYLGSYRERVYALQSMDSLDDERVMKAWDGLLSEHPNAIFKLNGHLSADELLPYIQIAKAHHVEFTLVTDAASEKYHVVAALIANHAVHVDDVNIEDTLVEKDTSKQQEAEKQETVKPKKKWYQRFF